MSSSPENPAAEPSATGSRWPMLFVTGLLAVGVAFLVTPNEMTSFSRMETHRAAVLADPSNLSLREVHPVITYYRQLDRQLPPDARIFFSGMLGKNKNRHLLFYYFFARTYLFPREVEVSLDHQAVYRENWFEGVDAVSPEQLRTNGFDLILKIDDHGQVVAQPLTEKGALKP